jgi:hypothetical protein
MSLSCSVVGGAPPVPVEELALPGVDVGSPGGPAARCEAPSKFGSLIHHHRPRPRRANRALKLFPWSCGSGPVPGGGMAGVLERRRRVLRFPRPTRKWRGCGCTG